MLAVNKYSLLSIKMLLIFDMHEVNGALFLKLIFFWALLFPFSPIFFHFFPIFLFIRYLPFDKSFTSNLFLLQCLRWIHFSSFLSLIWWNVYFFLLSWFCTSIGFGLTFLSAVLFPINSPAASIFLLTIFMRQP